MAAPVNSSDAAIASDFSKRFILFLLGFLRLFQKNILCLGSRDQQALSKATIGTTKALSFAWMAGKKELSAGVVKAFKSFQMFPVPDGESGQS